MRKSYSIVAVAALILAHGKELNAGLVWDYSPATYADATISTAGLGLNQSTYFNFAEQVSFLDSVNLTGMDIYTRSSGDGINNPVAIGTSATIRVWDGFGLFGTPGSSIYDFTRPVSVIDTEGAAGTNVIRIHVDFTSPVVLAADTQYWIGMSGTSVNIGQLGLLGFMAPENNSMYMILGATPVGTMASDMAFRLHGDEIIEVTDTPEPASMALLELTALGGIALRWRQRRKCNTSMGTQVQATLMKGNP